MFQLTSMTDNEMRMISLWISVLLLSSCGYSIRNIDKPPPAEHETWAKQGVSPFLGVRKSLLECGLITLGGTTKEEYEQVGIVDVQDQINHSFLVDRCMLKNGFVEQNTRWTLKEACADMRYRDYPACQPNATIPTPSVERRLNGWYCKTKTDYEYCLKHALAPQLCSPEKTNNPPPECLADGQVPSPTSQTNSSSQIKPRANTYLPPDWMQQQAIQLQRDTQNQNNRQMNNMLKNTAPKMRR